MGCASSAPVVATDSGESQLAPPSTSTRRRPASTAEEASNTTKAKSSPFSRCTNNNTAAAALATRAALTTVTPQARSPERPRREGGGGSNGSDKNAGLSSPLSSLEEPPLSGSSTAKSQRGWRRGRGKGDASSKKKLPLARPASSAALVLRVLDEEEEANKSLPLTIVTDDFALGRVLGRGQFGTTRLATRRDSGQLFACKIILKRKLSTPSAVAAVRREIAIMRRLDHPSIVKLHGVYEDDRAVHLIVALCEGGELFESIARNGKFSENCAASRAKSILVTVRYLHAKGVVHRDLKPENFLLSTKDCESPIKMIDFGLSAYAREGEDDERLSDVVGTAYYMAPEVLRGRYGHKADIWSVGVICFLMLSGMPPFRGDTERATFRSIVRDEPEFKGPAWRHVSPAAKEAIAAMLRKDPRKRPNASELLREFEWLEEAEKKRRTSIDEVVGLAAPGRGAPASAAAPAASTASPSFRKRAKPPQPPLQGEKQAPSPSSPSPSPSSSLQELSAPLDPAVKDSLRRFVGSDKLKRQATLLVVGRLRGGPEQMAALRAACAMLDAEGRGIISVDQLRDAITCVASHAGGDHGKSCAVAEAKRAMERVGEAAEGAEAPKAATSALSPSSSSNKLSRCCSIEGGEQQEEEQEGDASCGCSLSSSMCDLFAAEERAQQDQQRKHQREQQQGELLHLSSRPTSAAVSECADLDNGDGVRDQHRHHRQQRPLHHRHLKHDCCSELGALLREVCDEFREGCRLDYNRFVDCALQGSARVK